MLASRSGSASRAGTASIATGALLGSGENLLTDLRVLDACARSAQLLKAVLMSPLRVRERAVRLNLRAAVTPFCIMFCPSLVWASDVTWEQIVNHRIEIVLHQERKLQIDEGIFTDQHRWHFVVNPGASGAIRYSRQDFGKWVDRPGNRKPSASPIRSRETALGKVDLNPDGKGNAVWTFKAGRLTRLSVDVGTHGRTLAIAFVKKGDSLTCSAEITDVGEKGKANSWFNGKGQKRTLIAIVRQSATCEVKKL